MRVPDDLPRRRRRRRSEGGGNRRRVLLIVAAVAAFFLLTSLRGFAGLYTDYLWFDSLGQWGTRRTMLTAQFTLALIFIVAFFLLAWSNLYMAERLAPPFRPAGPEDELLERYHELVAGRMGRVRIVVAALLALIAGSGASAEWNSWLLFIHGRSFGIEDPQFHEDIGFYVFKLPFLSFVVDWLFASLLIVLIITAVAHYLNGGIRVQSAAPRVTSQVKAHLSVLLAVLALVKTADYWLQRYELTLSTRGVVDGATYTDVNAQLPALNLLLLISVAAAALFVGNIFRRGWALPVVAVGLWAFVAVTVGGIYPQFVQWSQVSNSEFAREENYIDRNIEATRHAMGLDQVRTEDFPPQYDVAQVDLPANESTIRNIRLWDPSPSVAGQVFEQLQRIRDYYRIGDIDVDRYAVDGQLTQVQLGARTINPTGVPGDSWENQHLAYTHGQGVVVAPSNSSAGGQPDFLVRDVPVRAPTDGSLAVEQPDVYFGEGLGGYSIVNTSRDEVDYQDEDDTQTTEYEGEDGVAVGSMFRRAAFALRFGDFSPLLSDYLQEDSRVIYIRDVIDRVEMLAPFLHPDSDPYPVVLDGEIVWVVDLYTTTNRYPYGQRADGGQVPDASGLNRDFNYVRNSVKATVDAYDGTVHFYVMPGEDPIIEAYDAAFPDLFEPASAMPDGLDEHLRYPEDLFRVQTAAWQRYHLSEPAAFYDQDDGWLVARDPGTVGVAENPTTNTTSSDSQDDADTNGATRAGLGTDDPIPPYYQLLQLPGETEAEFVLMRPFVPFSDNFDRMQLTGFMAARMDPGHYGELVTYRMPGDELPAGPGIIAAEMLATDEVRRVVRDASGAGGEVLYGNLLLLPVDNALLYVMPMYTQSTSGNRQVPQLEQVVVALAEEQSGQRVTRVEIARTLQEALEQLFGDLVSTQEDPTVEPPPEGGEPTTPAPSGSAEEQARDLLAQAVDLYGQAQDAYDSGDLGTYQDRQQEAEDLVRQASELLGGGTDTGTSPTTTTLPEGTDTDSADGTSTTTTSRPV